jgi:hypothetical protein
MNQMEALSRVKYDYPYSLAGSGTLSSSTAQTVIYINSGTYDYSIRSITLTARDSDGKLVINNEFTATDLFTIQIIDGDGQAFFENPIPLENLQSYVQSVNYNGFVLRRQNKYTIQIAGAGFPATPVLDYPLRFDKAFNGHRMND